MPDPADDPISFDFAAEEVQNIENEKERKESEEVNKAMQE